MALSSMTGFAQSSGEKDGLYWQWEIKSVNGKALDIRCRLPSGFEALEALARTTLSRHIKRGNLQVTLSTSGATASEAVVVNQAVLEQVLGIAEKLRDRIGGAPLNAEALMGLRGVLDVVQPSQSEAAVEARLAVVSSSLEKAATALDAARREEGARLSAVIAAQLEKIESLVSAARDCPARSAEAISFFASWLSSGNEYQSLAFAAIGGFPILVTCLGFVYFAIFDPKKLQSEDYQIRHEALELIKEKGSAFEIAPSSLEAIANPYQARLKRDAK